MGDYEEEKVTDEERIQAATSFLKSAPLAEYKMVHKEVSALLNDQATLSKAVAQVPPSWEARNAPIISGEQKLLITKPGKLKNGEYASCRYGKAFTIDFAKQSVTETRDLTPEEKGALGMDDTTRKALEAEVDAYLADHMDPHGKGEVFKKGDDYVICLHADNAKMAAFWTGNWTAQATLKPSEGKVEMSTRVQVHYWEDGNVQMNSTHKSTSNVKNDDDKVKNTMKALKDFLLTYHSAISKAYIQMDANTFKNLRRKLPITKQKMQWDKLEQYMIGKDTASGS